MLKGYKSAMSWRKRPHRKNQGVDKKEILENSDKRENLIVSTSDQVGC